MHFAGDGVRATGEVWRLSSAGVRTGGNGGGATATGSCGGCVGLGVG